MLLRKYLRTTEANKNENEAKLNFQGQSARSHIWFDLDFDRIEINFITRKPDFYRETFQRHDNTKDTNTFKIFEVSIIDSECVKKGFKVIPQCSSIFKSH